MPNTETQVQDPPEQEESFVWITQIGEPIRFEDMGQKHLTNTRGFIIRRLKVLQNAHDQQAMDQNMFGDNPEGFTGFETRIKYMQTALKLANEELNRRGKAQHA